MYLPLGHSPPHCHLFLHLEVLKRLMGEIDLPQDLPTLRTWLGTEGEQSVYTALAHLVIAGRDEQPEILVELPVRMTNRTRIAICLFALSAPALCPRAVRMTHPVLCHSLRLISYARDVQVSIVRFAVGRRARASNARSVERAPGWTCDRSPRYRWLRWAWP